MSPCRAVPYGTLRGPPGARLPVGREFRTVTHGYFVQCTQYASGCRQFNRYCQCIAERHGAGLRRPAASAYLIVWQCQVRQGPPRSGAVQVVAAGPGSVTTPSPSRGRVGAESNCDNSTPFTLLHAAAQPSHASLSSLRTVMTVRVVPYHSAAVCRVMVLPRPSSRSCQCRLRAP